MPSDGREMSVAITTAEFDLIRSYVETQCGITLGDNKRYLIETRLARLLSETGSRTYGELFRTISRSRDVGLRDKVVDAITTNETLWFRDGTPWFGFRDHVLPELEVRVRERPGQIIRIWSAACSTGQEPYTLAMLIDDYCRRNPSSALTPRRFEILATDISPSALFIAKAGRYDTIMMGRGLTGEWAGFRQRYFTQTGHMSCLSQQIKSRVSFRRFNLQDPFGGLGRFNLVLLRNVAIYFSETFKRNLIKRIRSLLVEPGYLLLGAAESLTPYSDEFEMRELGRATYYQRSGQAGRSQPVSLGAR